VKSGAAREGWTLSNQVFCFVGRTVLILPNARPRIPSDAGSEVKELDT
jgi:hypothetical protein